MNDLKERVHEAIASKLEWTGYEPKRVYVSIADWDEFTLEMLKIGKFSVRVEELEGCHVNHVCGLQVFRVIESGVLEVV